MEIILLQDVEMLGHAGDIIRVKPGYARNYLFPRQMALRASNRNRALAEEKKRNSEKRRTHDDKVNQALARQINNLELTFEVQVGDEEKMFGSVTKADIQKMLEDKGIQVDKHIIGMNDSLRGLGIYHIPIKIAANLTPEIKVYVIKA